MGILTRLLGCCLLAAGAAAQAGEPDRRAIIEAADRAVVTLYEGTRFCGSGFFVDDMGRIATNVHVVAGRATLTARRRDGKAIPVTGFYLAHEGLDLAVLATERASGYLPLRPDPVSEGDRVFSYGPYRSDRRDWQLREGKVLRGVDAGWFPYSGFTRDGYSGSPVLNERGEVVGVATRWGKDGHPGAGGQATSADQLRLIVIGAQVQDEIKPLSRLPARKEKPKK